MAPIAIVVVVAACSGPVAANPPAAHPLVTPVPTATPGPPDPRPVLLPADDAPHDRLTEWWYYTGHLRDDTGGSWGFEFVIFRAERGGFPVSWASHLALTDERGGTFHYAQRAEIGPQVNLDRPGVGGTDGHPSGFDLGIRGFDPLVPSTVARQPWVMSGMDGTDELAAAAATDEVAGDPASGFSLALALAATRPPTLHDGDGYIDFGPAGGSYYVSRTAMDARGTISVGDRRLSVTGSAWFDHQWGDFIAVGAGGWDWFAINLADGTDIMLSLVRAADGSYPLVYGTYVPRAGATEPMDGSAFSVRVADTWTSPITGTRYPAGWSISIPGHQLRIDLSPTVAQQELDTRATTGVVYWEGSQRVTATRAGEPLGGQAYVELTGYLGGP
jgi:predicted secreted hydrolase